MQFHKIIIIDFGSQYTQLIARRIRELGVYSIIKSPYDSIDIDNTVKGIILSGGPSSVYDNNSPDIDNEILQQNIPILGICYGMQLIAKKMGGNVERSIKREYGKALFKHKNNTLLFKNIPDSSIVWMSHSDKITALPNGFEVAGSSDNTIYAAIFNKDMNIYALQFHPEVYHSEYGSEMLKNFLFHICKAEKNWTPENFINEKINQIKKQVKDNTVISGISGGVDSTVATEIVHRAIGEQLKGFLIDTGLLRYNEGKETVGQLKSHLNIDIRYIDKSDIFLNRLKGIIDPEQKRKIIGNTFIKVFEEQAMQFKEAKFLVQGTIYPDRIESQSVKGPSTLIKSHHNVGGLPDNMKLELIEPLKELFKDEVRNVGKVLDIPEELLNKHPFPGPGLAVRIIGEINEQRIDILQKADKIFIDTLKKYNIYNDIWQAFAVFLPVKSVGVMGDNRTYENIIALRAVNSIDGMTADWFDFPKNILDEISTRIINEVNGVNRVVYDISTKPPSTIEWE